MDVLMLHRRAIERYQGYIRSFIDIRDDDIRQEVISQLDSGKLWPEPLIQFNPAYKAGASIQALVKEGVLRPELEKVFKGYLLRLMRFSDPPALNRSRFRPGVRI
jgi:hypothetical protein